MNKKIFIATLILFLIILLFNNYLVFANYEYAIQQVSQDNFGDPVENPELWEPTIENQPELIEIVNILLGVINVIGVIVAIIVLVVLGIKYIVGSVEEKAEYKNTFGQYILGAFLLASATTIPNIIFEIVMDLI